jgi:hypothetical protein
LISGDEFTGPHARVLKADLEAFVSASKSVGEVGERLASMTTTMTQEDSTSDTEITAIARITYHSAQLCEDEATSEGLHSAFAAIGGDNLTPLVRARYDALGGEAIRRAQALTPVMRAAMAKVVIDGKSLLDQFDGWVERAKALTAMELRRRELAATLKDSPKVTQQDLLNMQRSLVRRANRLLDALEDSSIDPAERLRIRAPIERSVREANQAAAARRAASKA